MGLDLYWSLRWLYENNKSAFVVKKWKEEIQTMQYKTMNLIFLI